MTILTRCLFFFFTDTATTEIYTLSLHDALPILATKRLSKGRFRWWPTGTEPSRTLRAHQAQLLLAAGNPDAEAPPAWRPCNPEEISESTKNTCVPFSTLPH